MAKKNQEQSEFNKLLQDEITLRELEQGLQDKLLQSVKNKERISTNAQIVQQDLNKSLLESVSTEDKIEAIKQAQDKLLDEAVSKGKVINAEHYKRLDTAKQLLVKSKEEADTTKTLKDGLKGAKDELLGSLGPAGQLVSQMLAAGTAVAIMVVALTAALKFIIDMVRRGIELNQTLGMSAKDSTALEANIMGASYSMEGLLYSTEEMRASAMALVDTMGRVQVPSQLITDATRLTKLLGGDDASGTSLARSLKNAGHNQTKLTDDIEAMATSMGMTAGPAMEMLVLNQMKLGSLSHEQIVAEARKGLEIKKQGLDVKKMNAMMREALDIEGSMRSAMKLRIMSGKEINFNAINQAKLAGDEAGLAKALNDQIALMGPGFETNHRMQQLMADGLNLSVEEMNNMRNATAENATAKAKEIELAAELVELQKTNSAATMETLLAQKASTEETGNGIMAMIGGMPMWAKLTAAIVGIGAALIGVTMLFPAVGAGIITITGAVGTGIASIGAGIGTALTSIGLGMVGLAAGSVGVPVLLALTLAVIGFGAALYLATPAIVAIGGVLKTVFEGIGLIVTNIGNVIIGIFSEIPPIITAVADGLVNMMNAVTMENVGAMLLLGPALMGVAFGLAAIGMMGIPGLLALTGLGAVTVLLAPSLMGIADSIGDMMGGDSDESDTDESDTDDGDSALITEIKALGRELIGMRGDIQSQPILINVDGKVVSEMTKIQNRQGVSKNVYRK